MNNSNWLEPILKTVSDSREWISQFPKNIYGSRFQYRELNGEWQVYGEGLLHVCMCQNEQNAKEITGALNMRYL